LLLYRADFNTPVARQSAETAFTLKKTGSPMQLAYGRAVVGWRRVLPLGF
jgi:hypothetical protein